MIDLVRLPSRNGLSGWRVAALAIAMAAMGFIMIWRLISLQVLDPERYVEHGESQRIRTTSLAAERGAIVDRNGVELAVSSPRESIWADPRLTAYADPADIARRIVAVTGGDVDQLTRRLSNEDAKFAWMARQLDDPTAQKVLDLGLPGIYAKREQARLTPSGGNVARGILGRTDIDGIGLSGLEAQYDEILTGESGQVVVERGIASGGARAVTIPDGEYELVSPQPGDSLVLTLDRTVQFEVENLLERTVAESGAKSGTVIVSRTATGEILAMSTVARTADGIIQVSGENKAVTWIVEPGSISKPLAIAALLEEGLITPETTVEVTQQIEIYDVEFSDPVPHGQAVMTTGEVLANSSNVGVALLVDRISSDRFHDYLSDYGLGTATALNFPGESSGILHPKDEWSGVSKPFAAIGYGYAATPLQMLRAYNVFANDGLLVEPHLVSGIRSSNGDLEIVSPREGRRVLSPETAHQITALLAGVVREGGTGVLASVPGYQIAGKTGTARIAQPVGGYEDENGDVHLLTSFAGYLPAGNPELSIIVMIEEPGGNASGGRVAAPLFGEISNFALQHFRIPPAAAVADR
ncbi:MAG: cell division protein FtsI (penicillin-binding protein 3) [Verrucomicrobiales bacterium]|jgi:cell division protein FtsI (penicillin-binding protein 3)